MTSPNNSNELVKVSLNDFLNLHQAQLEANGVPQVYWETLFSKLAAETFDAGLHFSLLRVEYEDSEEMGWRAVVSNPNGVQTADKNSVFLVDHAWTYDMTNAYKTLSTVEGLLDRMCTLMDCGGNSNDKETKINRVLDTMWKYNQTYSFAGAEKGSAEATPVWYVLDEFGSRIQHSDEPNIKMVPFFNSYNNTSYSLFWPLTDLEENEEITRDYAPHIPASEELSRLARLLPWNPCDFTDLDEQVDEPEDSYFALSRMADLDMSNVREVTPPANRQMLVWTDNHVVSQYLTHQRFKLTDNRDEADIIWQLGYIKDFRELSKRDVLLNQFPYEELLTLKDMLAVVSRGAAPPGEPYPKWMPVTFNLNKDLPEFICHFQKRAERGEDNHWIAKPWNLGRGLGHVVSKNIDCLIRLPEAGPFIAMKYIENPVLFHRADVGEAKFDYRYEVYLKSIRPLKVSCGKRFFLRFANKEYSLDSLHLYEKHFTVHNYSDPAGLLNMNCEDFLPEWNKQYPSHPWADIECETMQCVKELFEAVSKKDPPRGMPHYPQSRAFYAIDLMLKWDIDEQGHKVMAPQILECNFTPDSKRGCENYNDYFNVTFKALFLDEPTDPNEEIIVS